ncbi:hypothetical protein EDB86DRAFT_2227077 [Lactarius hatsudake]|nr:hypothetical protein EDB86DRAFT_2227077 [Lactarius hatsudake]
METQQRPSYNESVRQRTAPFCTGYSGERRSTYLFMIGEHKFVVNPVLKILCSPIMNVMFFWTLAELSQEARKNSGFCNNSFDTSVEKRDWQTYHIACNLVACDMVLCANRQSTTTARPQNFRRHMSRSEWCDANNYFQSLSSWSLPNTTNSGEMSKSIWRISEAQMTMYLMRQTNNFESTTRAYVPFVTMLDLCDEKRCTGKYGLRGIS